MDALHPPTATLIKLGSIARHAEEAISDDGHPFDMVAVRSLLLDPDVRDWMVAADKLALLPVKR